MKITKITKILPIALALSLSIGVASAESTLQSGTASATANDPSDTANIEYQLTLSDYVRIHENSVDTTVNATYGAGYESLTLNGKFTADFEVITNKARNVVLQSPCYGDESVSALYGLDEDHNFNVVFVNSSTTFDSDSVTDITGGSTAPDLNPDAFAVSFNALEVSTVHNNSDGQAKTTTITSSENAGNIVFAIPNGVSTLSFQSVDVIPTTFNTRDTAGIYKAKLILTDQASM